MSHVHRDHPDCTDASGHRFRDAYAGRYRCIHCGYDYERHGMPGMGFPEGGTWPYYYVDRVYSMPGESRYMWTPGDGWVLKEKTT
jgi:hypothetical protein